MIPANVINEIKYRSDIETLISQYVTLKRAGSNLKGLCPFHSEKTPSFTVYPESQSFYCFGCGAAGDAISFVMRMENLDYVSAIESLAKRAGITLPVFDDYGNRDKGVTKTRIMEANLEAAKFYRDNLFDEQTGREAREYFAKRHVSSAAVKRFGLGYAPNDWSALMKHLKSKGFTEEEMTAASLIRKSERGGYYDFFRGRVMFPIFDVSGNVIAFGGRVLDDSKPKYLNSSDTAAFKKTRNLFALNYAKSSNDGYFILCEGYMDVITLHDAGFNMAVAPLGTALTPEQARTIKRYAGKVIVSTDSDAAGQEAANRDIKILEDAGLETKVLSITNAKDPDEYIKKYGAQSFRELIEGSKTKFEFVLQRICSKYDMDSINGKVRATSEICEYIAGVPSNIERELYVSGVAKKFELEKASVQNDVERIRKRLAAEYAKKQKGELIRVTTGLDDRINPDFAKTPKIAKLEEALLGMIFLHNEYLDLKYEDKAVGEDDFSTSLGKRFLSFIRSCNADGGFSLGMLNEEFTTDEVSRAYRMIAERNELTGNTEEVFLLNLQALRKANEESENSGISLEELINKKRNKK